MIKYLTIREWLNKVLLMRTIYSQKLEEGWYLGRSQGWAKRVIWAQKVVFLRIFHLGSVRKD